jgi:hypothetical protein
VFHELLNETLEVYQKPTEPELQQTQKPCSRYIILVTQSLKFPHMSLYNPTTSAAHDGVVFRQHMATPVAMD